MSSRYAQTIQRPYITVIVQLGWVESRWFVTTVWVAVLPVFWPGSTSSCH
jgi:hypothetical protein